MLFYKLQRSPKTIRFRVNFCELSVEYILMVKVNVYGTLQSYYI